jgi:hypothetical protein
MAQNSRCNIAATILLLSGKREQDRDVTSEHYEPLTMFLNFFHSKDEDQAVASYGV